MNRVALFYACINCYLFVQKQISRIISLNSHADLCMQLLLQRSLFVRLACNALIQAGLSVYDRSTCGQFAQNLQLRSQVSGAYNYWRVVKKQYIWTFALNLTNSQGRQYVVSRRLKENQTNNTVLRTEITFQVLNKYVVAVIIRMETYKNIE